MKFSEIDAERERWTDYRSEIGRQLAELESKRAKVVHPTGMVEDRNRAKARKLDDQIAHVVAQRNQIELELKRLDEAWDAERARIKELQASRARLAAGLEPGAISESEIRLENPAFVLADHLAELRAKIARLDAEIGEVQYG